MIQNLQQGFMLTEQDIKEFYDHFEKLGLKRPVAAISQATGWNKGNVSQYLSGKLEPSESFIEAFYKAFPKSIKNVSRENNGVMEEVKAASTGQLLETINLLVRQNDKLAETNRILAEKITTIPVGAESEIQRSVDAMLQGLREFSLKLAVGTRYKSLEEARAAYRKELGDVVLKTKVRDTRSG